MKFKLHVPRQIINPNPYNLEGHIEFPILELPLNKENQVVIYAIQLLFKRAGTIILKCMVENSTKNFCLKLKYPSEDIEKEIKIYKQMKENQNDKALTLFPKVYAILRFANQGTESWGALLMDYYHISAVQVLYNSHHMNNKAFNAILDKNYEKLKATSHRESKSIGTHGNPIPIIRSQTLKNAILMSCIMLLNDLHNCGWIHGDSHLGNFMIDINEMSVVMIDTERSFESSESGLRLMDIQEVMGHATMLTVSMPYTASWDLCDIAGVCALLHPLNAMMKVNDSYDFSPNYTEILRTTFPDYNVDNASLYLQQCTLFFFLPVCMCFTHEDPSKRGKGCICCKSKLNTDTSKILYANDKIIYKILELLHHVSLNQLQQIVSCSRTLVRDRLSNAKLHYPKENHFMQMLMSHIKPSDFNFFVDIDQTGNWEKEDLYLRYILFLSAFTRCTHKKTRKFLNLLKISDHEDAYLYFSNAIAPPYKGQLDIWNHLSQTLIS